MLLCEQTDFDSLDLWQYLKIDYTKVIVGSLKGSRTRQIKRPNLAKIKSSNNDILL